MPSFAHGVLGPGDDDLLGLGEAVAPGEEAARIDHVGTPAADAREPAERGGVVDRAEDQQARRREGDVDEDVAAELGALRPHELLGDLVGGRAVGGDERLASGVGGRSARWSRRRARPRGRRRRTATRGRGAAPRRRSRRRRAGRPPRPRRRRSRSAGASAARRRARPRPPGSPRPRRSRRRPSRSTSPALEIAIFAPGGRGAERRTATTVASATSSPARPTSSSQGEDVLQPVSVRSATRGELLERADRVAGEERVDVRQRRDHPAGERLVARAGP